MITKLKYTFIFDDLYTLFSYFFIKKEHTHCPRRDKFPYFYFMS